MSIVIKGIDLPKDIDELRLIINGMSIAIEPTEVTQIPTPHGRLIDRDDIYIGRWDIDSDLAEQIQNAPTILEAEE